MTTLIPKYDEGATGAVNRPINLKLNEIISVKDFGAVGNGITDDTAAINAAIAAIPVTGGTLYFPASTGSYMISQTIIVNTNDLIINFNGQSVSYLSTYTKIGTGDFGIYNVMFAITSNRVTFVNGSFKQGSFTDSGSFIWIALGTDSCMVDKCKFYNLPYNTIGGVYAVTNGVAIQTRTTTSNAKITNCWFYNCSGSVSLQGTYNLINNCTSIINNSQPTSLAGTADQAYGLDGSTGCSITNTKVIRLGSIISGSIIGANSGAKDFIIANNYIYGIVGGVGYYIVNCNNGLVTNNIIDGAGYVATGPWDLAKIDSNSAAIVFSNNQLLNPPNTIIGSGLSVDTGQNSIVNNTFELNSGLVFSCIDVQEAVTQQSLLISGNTLNSSGIGVSFGVTTNNGQPITLSNNSYVGGITTPYSGTSLTVNAPLKIENEFFVGSSITTFAINNNKFFRPFSQGMWKFPISIKQNVVYYAAEVPTGPNFSTATWAAGDTVYNLAASVGSPTGWKCTVSGTPGTWVALANL
jgi:hypothetical protein